MLSSIYMSEYQLRKDPRQQHYKFTSMSLLLRPGSDTNYIQRCVIVQRDQRGYGLTVSGDNPVRIQSVKLNGAASKAGVQEGDTIIKELYRFAGLECSIAS
ncbi:Rho guanine nucleotide exchange factor 12 [Holothuria leucospilota]|uniref:Rho guanine nucleotide exchange factor 12 n=1 Tax=Holothuria leucospilota TaxID=206669 RepID=A0A9Q1BYM0_HOLLE|nr:Rho guanine nucleotide exchange factor 12 [Holothuria leucospilota]